MVELAAIVLAGGRATRLGGVDKALLTLGGQTMIGHILQRLAPGMASIAISANGDPMRYAQHALPVLGDHISGRGPLAGVLRGLDWAAGLGAHTLLSVPGDTPFIPPGLPARLGAAPAWAENIAGIHPLVALWPVACRTALSEWLAGPASGRVRAFGASIGMRSVWFADAPDPFCNVNTADDLAAARHRAAQP